MAGRSPADTAGQVGPLVLLAAGRSSRMGEPKGLVTFRGQPWIEHQLAAAAAAGVGRVVLVLGHDRERYVEALGKLPALPLAVDVALNEAPERGPFSSLQCGLDRVDPAAAAFVLPVDVPAPGPPVWQALCAALQRSPAADAAVPTLEGPLEGTPDGTPVGTGRGHPVLLAPTFVARLRAAPSHARLDIFLRDRDTAVTCVPVKEPRVRMNLNHPDDWGRLK